MKAEKALELVKKFASISTEIADASKEIKKSLDACPGFSGKRTPNMTEEIKVDKKGFETDVHLNQWYERPDRDEGWVEIQDGFINGEEDDFCPHCYAAHVAIQRRRALKTRLGTVKATMTRMAGPKQFKLNLKK